jgi:Flp pilus assembly protein TadD
MGNQQPRTFLSAALLLAVAAVYSPAPTFDFVNFDDPEYVAGNPHVLAGLTPAGIAWACTSFEHANWHPLTWLSLMLDAEIGGADPRVYHVTNVALHAANALLLFGILASLTGRLGRSAFVAALFAVHPLHVESVAWITERKDVLSTFFLLLALGAHVRYVRAPGIGRYVAVLAAFAAGLMAKPMLVTFPLMLLILDYCPLRRLGRAPEAAARPGRFGPIAEKLPPAILALASCGVTLWAQRGAVGSLDQVSLADRLANAAVSYVSYVSHAIWPAGLAVIYPHPRDTLPGWKVALCACALIAVSVLAVRTARRRPYLLAGWTWYVVTLLPVIGLVQVGVQAMADRYTYVPLLGIYAIGAWGVPGLLDRWGGIAPRLRARLLATAALAVVAALIPVARTQAGHWRDSVALFEHALAVTRDNYRAHAGLGKALATAGDTGAAIEQFREALRIRPQDGEAHADLAALLALAGRFAEAEERFVRAASLDPGNAEIRVNLGTTLMRQGRAQEAATAFREALALDPRNASAHKNLGVVLAREGDLESAVLHFSAAVEADPGDAEAVKNLQRAREILGR